MSIGKRIRQIRKERNLTMEAFGKQIGVTRNSISMIESEKNNPSDQTIRSICREFNVSEDWLRTGAGEATPTIPDDEITKVLQEYGLPMYMRELFLRYGSLTTAAQEAVRLFVRGLVAEITDNEQEKNSDEDVSATVPKPEVPVGGRMSEEEIQRELAEYEALLRGTQRLQRQFDVEKRLFGSDSSDFAEPDSSGELLNSENAG